MKRGCMTISNMKYEKRLAIYATYDKEGIIDAYIPYCLQELHKVADDIVVVSNHVLSQEQKSRLSMAEEVFERDDVGFDVGGFAYVIGWLTAQDRLKDYDEIIFMNDSVFGPFYPFWEMFDAMGAREKLDFWGITKRGVSDFDGGDAVYPEHIQLYFYVVRKNMAQSREFINYWRTIVDELTDFRSAILNYEFMFTQYFADRGYLWDVYCHAEVFETNDPKKNLSPYHYHSYELIKNEKCPLLKRKLFTGDFIDGRICDRSDLKKAVAFVAERLDYDVSLIWTHILRVYCLEDIMKSMQMVELFDGGNREAVWDSSCVRVIGGCEANPPVSSGAEYIVYIPEEEDADKSYPLTDAERNCVMENLLSSNAYMAEIARFFAENPLLGVLVPPAMTFGKVSKSINHRWQNQEKAEEIIKKYNISALRGKGAPIHAIHAFWCRSGILGKELLDDLQNDRTGTVMQAIPLFAQQKGFYTEIAVNRNYVARLLMNMQHMTSELLGVCLCGTDCRDMGGDGDNDMDMEKIHDMLYRKMISEYVSGKKVIYIYGAGQLACRIIRIMDAFRKPDGIIVSDKAGNSGTICGYSVMGIDDIDICGISFIVAVGKKNNSIVAAKLEALGITDYLLLM